MVGPFGVRGMGRRHRRAVAAVLAGAAVLLLGLSLQPRSPDIASVVVAGRDLPTGHRLTGEDLQRGMVARELLPPATVDDPGALVGRVLAAPVAQGEPVTELRLVGAAPWRTAPGASAVPVRSADPRATALLSAGQRVDLLSTPTMGVDTAGAGSPAVARPIAQDVLVLAVVESDDSGPLAGVGQDSGDPLVVVEATPSQALAIIGARASGGLWFTLR